MNRLRRPLRGQAATEYLLVVALLALALGFTADGPLQRLVEAIASHHARFTWSISLP
jgi:hypothetical protein